jgi:hypothetical protein
METASFGRLWASIANTAIRILEFYTATRHVVYRGPFWKASGVSRDIESQPVNPVVGNWMGVNNR